eukprot:TRINITY_DN5127_c0_g1_i1.p1 TRINITY_DN5127_c0_g1~~TRINITY_DN5127_c0_g1_i1.p1  ORF type:complete len:548 (+),score=74.64 TRINITY_DN5127_c0_g1_i1:71-1645(+)
MNVSGQTFIYSISGPESNMRPEDITDIQEKATFDPEIFFYLILPPIIFNAGYSMRKKHFFHNIGSILTFALLGTVISTFVIAAIMWLVAKTMTISITFLETLHFGCIISATDPVTTLAIFTDLNVDPTLNGLVLGESLLNDAVALVLVGSLEDYSKLFDNNESDASQVIAIFKSILHFFTIFFGSVGLGAFMGILTALLTKYTHIRDYPILETSLFFLLSYSSYLLAEVASMSGIVSVLFCGICQAHYTFSNLSQESKVRTRQLFELLNFLMENFIFSYIGVSMFTFSRHRFEFLFILGALLAIGVARALNIYPLSFLLNLGRKKKIPCNFQHMMWFSGLRGALSFALAIKNTVTEPRQVFLTTTSLIAIFTVIFCGGLTTPLLGFLKIPIGVIQDDSNDTNLCDRDGYEEPEAEAQRTPTQVRRSALARTWKSIDSAVLKPLLTHSRPTLMDTMHWMGPVARWLTTQEQMTGEYSSREHEAFAKGDTGVGAGAAGLGASGSSASLPRSSGSLPQDENSLSNGD